MLVFRTSQSGIELFVPLFLQPADKQLEHIVQKMGFRLSRGPPDLGEKR